MKRYHISTIDELCGKLIELPDTPRRGDLVTVDFMGIKREYVTVKVRFEAGWDVIELVMEAVC